MTPFMTTLEMVESRCTLSVHGEVDIATAPLLHAAAVRALSDFGALTIDLGPTSFLDARGLRVLLHIKQAAPSTRIVHPSRCVRQLMDITCTHLRLLGSTPDIVDLTHESGANPDGGAATTQRA